MKHGVTRWAATPALRTVGVPTPATSYPAEVGVRVPNPGFFSGITITSLIVPSIPGALALSSLLTELWLGVLLRSAALLGAALADSFIDDFTAALFILPAATRARPGASFTLLTALFIFPPQGRKDPSGVAGPYARTGLHPTVLP
jgi:hypothetical protein